METHHVSSLKRLKKTRLGIILISKCSDKEVQKIIIAFVDDSDFCTSRVESERKM